jgi:hypothetical protein
MPYIIRPKRARKLVAALFGTAMLVAAVPAAASAACPSSPTTEALSQYGDNAAYTLLSGSSFENGAPGWSLNNAQVESGEGANGGQGYLTIEPNGSAVSPVFCVSSEYPSFRFFAHKLNGPWWSWLSVTLRWNENGYTHEAFVSPIKHGGSWDLTPSLNLASILPLGAPESTVNAQLVFQPRWGSSWAIDSVYIDPYSR